MAANGSRGKIYDDAYGIAYAGFQSQGYVVYKNRTWQAGNSRSAGKIAVIGANWR